MLVAVLLDEVAPPFPSDGAVDSLLFIDRSTERMSHAAHGAVDKRRAVLTKGEEVVTTAVELEHRGRRQRTKHTAGMCSSLCYLCIG